MFVSTIVPAILAMASVSLALPTRDLSMALFEAIHAPQRGWAEEKVDFAKTESKIQLRIQLTHQNMDQFYERALNVCQTTILSPAIPLLFCPSGLH
jgi:hypothetical protein